MKTKKQIRKEFRDAVFGRDSNKCLKCKDEAKDAHHIQNRDKTPNGGYVKENGISLCFICHLKAEEFHKTKGEDCFEGFHPNDLYEMIGSNYKLAVEKSKLIK